MQAEPRDPVCYAPLCMHLVSVPFPSERSEQTWVSVLWAQRWLGHLTLKGYFELLFLNVDQMNWGNRWNLSRCS